MSYLKSKRIVVTGGAGFLGKNVVAELEGHGCKDIFSTCFGLNIYNY